MRQFILFILLSIGQVINAQGTWRIIPSPENDIVEKYSEAYEYRVDGVGRFVFWDFNLT